MDDPEGVLATSGLDEEAQQLARAGDMGRTNRRLLEEASEGGPLGTSDSFHPVIIHETVSRWLIPESGQS